MIDDELCLRRPRQSARWLGIGQTAFSRDSGPQRGCRWPPRASLKAIADAGLTGRRHRRHRPLRAGTRSALQLWPPRWAGRTSPTGPTPARAAWRPCMMMGLAMGRGDVGAAKAVLAFRSLNGPLGVAASAPDQPHDRRRCRRLRQLRRVLPALRPADRRADLRPDGAPPHAGIRHHARAAGRVAMACREHANQHAARPDGRQGDVRWTTILASADDLRRRCG
jgi:hypothetical protein